MLVKLSTTSANKIITLSGVALKIKKHGQTYLLNDIEGKLYHSGSIAECLSCAMEYGWKNTDIDAGYFISEYLGHNEFSPIVWAPTKGNAAQIEAILKLNCNLRNYSKDIFSRGIHNPEFTVIKDLRIAS
jgi:hypothetical protein